MDPDRQTLNLPAFADQKSADPLKAFDEGAINRHQLHHIIAEDLCEWLESVIRHSPFLQITGNQFNVTNFTQGWTNITFEVSSDQGNFIARIAVGVNGARSLAQHANWSKFEKEHQWQSVLRQRDPLLAAVIPEHFGCIYVPTSDASALLADYAGKFGHSTIAVSLQRKLSGQPIWNLPESKLENAFSAMGEIAAAINKVETSHVGNSYSVEHQKFFYHEPTERISVEDRVRFLTEEARGSLQTLNLTPEKYLEVEEAITRFENSEFQPRLIFGDFNSGNFLCSENGRISALFDFETIRSDLGIQDELSGVFLIVKPKEYEAFIKGYAGALEMSSEAFYAMYGDDIIASAWIGALSAGAGTWKESALRKLEPLLGNNEWWQLIR